MITADKALVTLTAICEQIAAGRYEKARELFEMTKEGRYPRPVAELAEAFGMMLVKVEALTRAGGNRSRAARDLGISREGLRKKMKRYGIA